MLRWRLLVGFLLAVALVGLCVLDHFAEVRGAVPGLWLAPVLVFFGGLATREVLDLTAAAGMRPQAWVVYLGNLAILASPWVSVIVSADGGGRTGDWQDRVFLAATLSGDWTVLALATALMLVFLGEMSRYEKPGGVTANLGGAFFAFLYVGLLLNFAVRLRLIWGVGAFATLVIVVKVGDTGAYAVGRLLGRHKMAPTLSPKKTVEGALGELAFALAASWASFHWLVPALAQGGTKGSMASSPWWGWIAFGFVLGLGAIVGDLAESLLKRDGGRKDSSSWLPGLGGILDVLDSVLLGAPLAYACWSSGLVGR